MLNPGKLNCSWSSCREGCTKEIFKCWQVLRVGVGVGVGDVGGVGVYVEVKFA